MKLQDSGVLKHNTGYSKETPNNTVVDIKKTVSVPIIRSVLSSTSVNSFSRHHCMVVASHMLGEDL